mgnify:CR=1 FL=1
MTRLTAPDLDELVPLVQSDDPRERERGQVELLSRGAALLQYWAQAEYDRHRTQFPSLEREDVHATITFHYLTALDDIDITQVKNSGVNWLYNRVTSRSRREIMDKYGTVQFSRYFLENARRTRAIINSLTDELGRLPTDEEIYERSKRPTGGMLGPKDRHLQERKPLSMSFIKRYWENSSALEMGEMPQDYELMDLSDVAPEGPDADLLHALYRKAAQQAGVTEKNLAVVFAVFGLYPFEESHTMPQASKKLGVSTEHGRKCVRAWAVMCNQQNGPFHLAMEEVSEEKLDEAGLLTTLYALRTAPVVGDWSVLTG